MSALARATTVSAAQPPQRTSTTVTSSSVPTTSANAALRSQWTKTFANGDSYQGEALHVHDKNQKPVKDGQGRYTWASSGAVYEGEWQGGRPHGQGVMTVPGADGYEYTGSFVEGLRSGQGRCRFANGRTYDGEWKADEMNGRGTVRGAPGVDDYEEYTGDFEVGKRSGAQGKCVYFNGDVYEGSWREGKRQGMGEWQLHRATSSLAVTPVRYKGPFDNDVPRTAGSVEAEVEYSDGSSYTGAVNTQLRRHGRGVHRLSSGDVFDGAFSQDQREGRGILQGGDGTVCDGTWRHGQLDGEVRVKFAAAELVGATATRRTGTAGGTGLDATADLRGLQQLSRSPYPLASYEGPCTAGVLTGAPATLLFADGSSYRGAVRHGLPHGSGILRDRPLPCTAASAGDVDGDSGKAGPRRRISTLCMPATVSMTLMCYEGSFSAGEPDGVGTAEWQLSLLSASPPPRSPSVVRATPSNFSELLASGLPWWRASTYAVVDGTYAGQWLRGLPHGEGRWKWADGSSYTGGVACYLPSGCGTYLSPNLHYTGDFVEGQPEGKGVLEDKACGVTYDGEWKGGTPSGEGACTVVMEYGSSTSSAARAQPNSPSISVASPCTVVYEGTWDSGKPAGHGRTYANADRQRVVYDGQYVDGRCEGEGTLYFGSVRRGSLNGDAAAAAVHAYAQYSGAFHRGKPGGGGIGCLTMRNNTTIEGAFDANLLPCAGAAITVRPHNEAWLFTGTFDATTRVGRGTMTFPNGDVYRGEVEDAGAADDGATRAPLLYAMQRHGQGVYTFVEGNELQCTWRHNVLHGPGVYTSADGAKTERSYTDGVLSNDNAMSSVGASAGLSSVGTGGSIGNVFTPENEFPNTLSEDALKSRLPEQQSQLPIQPPAHQPQQQQQQRKRAPFNFVRRGEARQASAAGAAPSPSPRHASVDNRNMGDIGNKKGHERSLSAAAPPQVASTSPKHNAAARRGSSPPSSTRAAGGASAASREVNDEGSRTPTRAAGSTPSASASGAAHKYSLRRHPASTKANNSHGPAPSSPSTNACSGQGDGKQRDSLVKGASQPSNSVYLNRFQAGIRQLDDVPPRSPSPSAGMSAGASPTADKAARRASPPTTTPAREGGPLRRRLSSALAAGREQQQDVLREKQSPVTLQGSLKEMMKDACAIRSSREDEIHLLTEEMRQLNERIWQLRFVIASHQDSGAKAATPSPGRRLSKTAEGVRGAEKDTPESKTQRLAALIQERRIIMEKLQYVVNDPG